MSRPSKNIIESRDYDLNPEFPILLLSGDRWHISDIPSNRLHFHNCLEIGICHTGSGTLAFEDKLVRFRAGDISCIAPYVPHTTYSAKGTSSLWSFLFLDPGELLEGYFGKSSPSASGLDELLQSFYCVIESDAQPAVQQLVLSIIREMQQKQENYRLAVRGICLALLMCTLRVGRGAAAEAALVPGPQNSLVIAPALEYIKANYMQEFAVETLAELCHLSPTHFRRMFRTIMHCNPLEYINSVRIKHACNLLRSTEDSILSISCAVGFASISSFNRHFSHLNGCTPSEWRRTMTPLPHSSIHEYAGWL